LEKINRSKALTVFAGWRLYGFDTPIYETTYLLAIVWKFSHVWMHAWVLYPCITSM